MTSKISKNMSGASEALSTAQREDMLLFKGKYYDIDDLDTNGPTEEMLQTDNI
jgi:hypothetical protein